MVKELINAAGEQVSEKFGERLEDLVWMEDEDGILYAMDDTRRPEQVVSLTLSPDGITLSEEEVSQHEIRQFRTVSTPSSPDTSPQFD